jgi:decaprenylphospho-beta-D-ribofuranose 2-oxidase
MKKYLKINFKSFADSSKHIRSGVFYINDSLFYLKKYFLNCNGNVDNNYYPIGNQQSYGEVCIPSKNNKFIKFINNEITIYYEESNHVVKVSASIKIHELVAYLEKNKFYLKIVPGASDATIGGCISSDVHGKSSHKYGSFGEYIEELTIYDFEDENIKKINKKHLLMSQTIGGYGVTGLILDAKIKIYKMPGSSYELNVIKSSDINKLIKILINDGYKYEDAAIWFSIQRKIIYAKLYLANWSPEVVNSQFTLSYSFIFKIIGFFVWRKFFHKILAIFIHNQKEKRYISQNDICFPLSKKRGWSKIYGDSFIERQFIIPFSDYEDFIIELIDIFRKNKLNSPLCAIKVFNNNGNGILSFLKPGVSFNILHAISEVKFTEDLNFILNKYDSKEYLAKSTFGFSIFPKGYNNFRIWHNIGLKNKVNSLYMHKYNEANKL